MTQINNDMPEVEISVEEWLAIRKEAAKKIDPYTAEVRWNYALVADPYGVHTDLTDEEQCIGRVYFARSPGSDIWVEFGDLTAETLTVLRECGQERRALEAFEREFRAFCDRLDNARPRHE
jgi:hypothetical protein